MSYTYTRRPRLDQLEVMKRIFRVKRILVWGDIGSGKTKVVLDFIGTMLQHGKIQRALICGPKRALVGTWEQQIELDVPWLQYSKLMKKEEPDWTKPVILTNFDYFLARRKKKRSKRTGKIIPDKFVRDKSRIEALVAWLTQDDGATFVAIDESHRIRNRKAQAAKACHKLGNICEYAVALTGNPKGNKKILDLWSQFRFVYKDLLPDTFTDYMDEYCVVANVVHSHEGNTHREIIKFKNLPQLAKIIGPHMVRMKGPDVPFVDIPYRVDMSPKAKKLYKQMEKHFLAELDEENVVTAPIALTKMLKLSQIAGGFLRDEDGVDHFVHSDKLEALDEILEELADAGEKRVVIFCRFHWELEQIKKRLLNRSWPVYEISGRIKDVNQVKLAMSLFDSAGGAMLCQMQAGSESLNLQSANYMIHYSTDYSYINYNQSRGRIKREGQKKTCYFYQLRCRGTIDNRIYGLLEEHKSAESEFKRLIEEIRRDAA